MDGEVGCVGFGGCWREMNEAVCVVMDESLVVHGVKVLILWLVITVFRNGA